LRSSKHSRRKARVKRQAESLKRKRVPPFEVGQEIILPHYGTKYVITRFPTRASVVLKSVGYSLVSPLVLRIPIRTLKMCLEVKQ
jgi:hypothetical protein